MNGHKIDPLEPILISILKHCIYFTIHKSVIHLEDFLMFGMRLLQILDLMWNFMIKTIKTIEESIAHIRYDILHIINSENADFIKSNCFIAPPSFFRLIAFEDYE